MDRKFLFLLWMVTSFAFAQGNALDDKLGKTEEADEFEELLENPPSSQKTKSPPPREKQREIHPFFHFEFGPLLRNTNVPSSESAIASQWQLGCGLSPAPSYELEIFLQSAKSLTGKGGLLQFGIALTELMSPRLISPYFRVSSGFGSITRTVTQGITYAYAYGASNSYSYGSADTSDSAFFLGGEIGYRFFQGAPLQLELAARASFAYGAIAPVLYTGAKLGFFVVF